MKCPWVDGFEVPAEDPNAGCPFMSTCASPAPAAAAACCRICVERDDDSVAREVDARLFREMLVLGRTEEHRFDQPVSAGLDRAEQCPAAARVHDSGEHWPQTRAAFRPDRRAGALATPGAPSLQGQGLRTSHSRWALRKCPCNTKVVLLFHLFE
jgi:hypothetical protein